jgi:hypothetical protein
MPITLFVDAIDCLLLVSLEEGSIYAETGLDDLFLSSNLSEIRLLT